MDAMLLRMPEPRPTSPSNTEPTHHGLGGHEDATLTRPLTTGFRWLFGPFSLLALGASLSLTFAAAHTDEYFAWTIAPPLTAALLGAAYAGALVLFALSLRERAWANSRLAVPAPFTLSVLMLVATFIHIGRFHLHADLPAAAVAWIWLIVYIVVPPVIALLVFAQSRVSGDDPPRGQPLPTWLRIVMLAYGSAGLIGGMILFIEPTEIAPHWPWAITALTGRAVAAWLVALGVALLHALAENDWRRVRAGMIAFTVIGALCLLALARYSGDVRNGAGGVLLVATLASMTGFGAYGSWRSRAHTDKMPIPAHNDPRGNA